MAQCLNYTVNKVSRGNRCNTYGSFVQTADLFLGEYKDGPVEQIAIDKY